MTAAQIADQIAAAIAARAQDGGAGQVTVTIDGVTTTYSEKDAQDALHFWERRAARESGRRRRVVPIDLRRAF